MIYRQSCMHFQGKAKSWFLKVFLDKLFKIFRFYKTYDAVKDCPAFKDIPSFFRKYRAEIQPQYEPGGNMITLMKKLVDKIPLLKSSSYFVTRSNVLNEELLKDMDPTSVTLPEFFKHEQIAGKGSYSKIGRNSKFHPISAQFFEKVFEKSNSYSCKLIFHILIGVGHCYLSQRKCRQEKTLLHFLYSLVSGNLTIFPWRLYNLYMVAWDL